VNDPASPLFPDTAAALEWAGRELRQVESASLIAQVLLAHVWKQPRCWTLAHPELPLPPELCAPFASLVQRARGGEPLPYLTGIQEFYGLEFEVTPDVLIPRPETELLATTALDWLSDRSMDAVHNARPIRAVDLGAGSGCIAAVLSVHNPGLTMIASEISSAALAVAARNFRRHGVANRVHVVQADLLAPFSGPFDLLCANLPYCPTGTLARLDVRHFEPSLALDGGADGLRLISRALAQTAERIAENGLVLFEIEATQGKAAQELARRFFSQAAVSVGKDLAGLDRLLIVRT
jgi:release factor glutamine methyltransferase